MVTTRRGEARAAEERLAADCATALPQRTLCDDPSDSLVRSYLAKWVAAGTPQLVRFQAFFGVSKQSPGYAPIYWFFRLSAELGNEITFISFLPMLCWHGSGALMREVVLLWMLSTCIGQWFKDLLRLPRPPCPPVVRLEGAYQAEYGMPSTHVMGAVCLPFGVVHYLLVHDLVPTIPAFLFGSFWLVSVTLSRLYLGVHSPADCTVGFALGTVIMLSAIPLIDIIEQQLVDSPLFFLSALFVCIVVALIFFPAPRTHWSNTYGDMGRVMGVYLGVLTGMVLSQRDYACVMGVDSIGMTIVRPLVGIPLLFAVKAVVKKLCHVILLPLMPSSSVPVNNRYEIEVPTCLITYALIGMSSVTLSPFALRSLSLCDVPE